MGWGGQLHEKTEGVGQGGQLQYKRDLREDNQQNKTKTNKTISLTQMLTMHNDEPERAGPEGISPQSLGAKRTRNFL